MNFSLDKLRELYEKYPIIENGQKEVVIMKNDTEQAYNDGYAAGHTKGYTDGYSAGEASGIDIGRDAEHEEFWNVVMGAGARANYGYAFMGWNCEEIIPPAKISPTGGTMAMVFGNNPALIAVRADHFDFSGVPVAKSDTTGNYATFVACTALETIEDIGLMPNFSYNMTFANCKKLKTIAAMRVDADTAYNRAFAGCGALENITIIGVIGQNGFDVQYSPLLTHDSLLSIINALADKSGIDGTWKITLGTTNCAKLSDADKQLIVDRGWLYE